MADTERPEPLLVNGVGHHTTAVSPSAVLPLLRAAKKAGVLTFSQCVEVFAEPVDSPIVEAARQKHEREGEIEIDRHTVVSHSGYGAYVMAWVWVPYPEEDV